MEECKHGKTYVAMCNVIGAAESIQDWLGELRRKLVVAKQARVEDANGGDGVVVLHLISFGAATAVACSHDARAVHVQAVRTANDPLDSFGHPVNSGRTTTTTRSTRRDSDETVRGDLGQEVLGRRAVVATCSIAPD